MREIKLLLDDDVEFVTMQARVLDEEGFTTKEIKRIFNVSKDVFDMRENEEGCRMSRLTKSGTVSQRDINKLMELSDENQFGMNDAYYKLKEYEDLEEKGLLIKLSSTEDVYCIERIIECKYDYSLDKCPMYSKCGYCK